MNTIFLTDKELDDIDYTTLSLSNLKGISFCSLNIHSLSLKYDSIKLLRERSKIGRLMLNETYLNDSILDNELMLPNYQLYRYDRAKESGKLCSGGIAIYVNKQYTFQYIEDSFECNPSIETFWLKLSLKLRAAKDSSP